jgi:hypothetical protein
MGQEYPWKFRVMFYGTHASSMFQVWSPIDPVHAVLKSYEPAHLLLDEWLPIGPTGPDNPAHITSHIINSFPGTGQPLSHSYEIFYVSNAEEPNNRLVRKLFNESWWGNIVVVKLGKRKPGSVIHMQREDSALVDQIVMQYVDYYTVSYIARLTFFSAIILGDIEQM